MRNVDHVLFTAGVTGRPAGEDLIIATVYEGMRSTLAAAADVGFRGRFVYMTSIGVNRRSIAGSLLNLVKRNTLHWRRRAEEEIRASGLAYTVVRAGMLTNGPGGRRALLLGQEDYPLAAQYRIARADVAETLVQALEHPATSRTTFDVVQGRGGRREDWQALFGRLRPDACDRAADRDRRDAGPDPQMPAC